MAWWNRKPQVEKRDNNIPTIEDILLGAVLDPSSITKDQAMSIPAVAMCVNLISDTVASLPIKLYQEDETKEKVKCVDNDPRVKMLNLDTGDTLNGYQMKKALIEDFLMYGAGYVYINRQRNKVKSLNYVSNLQVSVRIDPNPIFKKNTILCYGGEYKDWEFIKITRKTKDGASGIGIISENNKPLSIALNTMLFEDLLYRTGGQRKGFLKSKTRLSPSAMTELKSAFKNLYANNSDGSNVVVLNDGLDFQEANNSSTELQLNQNKITNAQEIAKIFGIPTELMNGKATGGNEILYDTFVKMAILPVLKAFETALNKDLLLDKEKGSFYFAFQVEELLKGDIEKRFNAYEKAVKNGIFQVDEVRKKENLEPLGLGFVKLGLQDVLYFPDSKQVYTPNTNKQVVMGETPVDNTIDVPADNQNVPNEDNQSVPSEQTSIKGGENTNESGNSQ
jgi:HK97 family phage portal protein